MKRTRFEISVWEHNLEIHYPENSDMNPSTIKKRKNDVNEIIDPCTGDLIYIDIDTDIDDIDTDIDRMYLHDLRFQWVRNNIPTFDFTDNATRARLRIIPFVGIWNSLSHGSIDDIPDIPDLIDDIPDIPDLIDDIPDLIDSDDIPYMIDIDDIPDLIDIDIDIDDIPNLIDIPDLDTDTDDLDIDDIPDLIDSDDLPDLIDDLDSDSDDIPDSFWMSLYPTAIIDYNIHYERIIETGPNHVVFLGKDNQPITVQWNSRDHTISRVRTKRKSRENKQNPEQNHPKRVCRRVDKNDQDDPDLNMDTVRKMTRNDAIGVLSLKQYCFICDTPVYPGPLGGSICSGCGYITDSLFPSLE